MVLCWKHSAFRCTAFIKTFLNYKPGVSNFWVRSHIFIQNLQAINHWFYKYDIKLISAIGLQGLFIKTEHYSDISQNSLLLVEYWHINSLHIAATQLNTTVGLLHDHNCGETNTPFWIRSNGTDCPKKIMFYTVSLEHGSLPQRDSNCKVLLE